MARHRAARLITPAPHHQHPASPSKQQATPPLAPPATSLASPTLSSPTSPPLLTGADRLLRLQEVIALVSISRATIYRYLSAGTFPSPLQIGPRRVAWRASDINTWFSHLHTT